MTIVGGHGQPQWAVECDACGKHLPLPTRPELATGWETHEFSREYSVPLDAARTRRWQIHTCGCDASPARIVRFKEFERSMPW